MLLSSSKNLLTANLTNHTRLAVFFLSITSIAFFCAGVLFFGKIFCIFVVDIGVVCRG